jgi:hypothetical protein
MGRPRNSASSVERCALIHFEFTLWIKRYFVTVDAAISFALTYFNNVSIFTGVRRRLWARVTLCRHLLILEHARDAAVLFNTLRRCQRARKTITTIFISAPIADAWSGFARPPSGPSEQPLPKRNQLAMSSVFSGGELAGLVPTLMAD